MYTIKQVATLSGTTTRTLRYYDDINLFQPSYIGENGYRMYKEEQLDTLQYILFLKQFGLSLDNIKKTLQATDDKQTDILNAHYKKLLKEQEELSKLITTLKKTIAYRKGDIMMTDTEKFELFKEEKIQKNKEVYGEEVINKYGSESFNEANTHYKGLSKENYHKMNEAQKTLFDCLNTLDTQHVEDLDHPLANKAFQAHKNWLNLASPVYSPTYHQQMADMYLADERFSDYYLEYISQNGLNLLKKIVYYYTSKA